MYNQESKKTNNYVGGCNPVKNMSEFDIILDKFEYEINHSIDLYKELFKYANALQTIYLPDDISEEIEKEPQGIIERLNSQLWRLQKSNANLVHVANHLKKLIDN